MKPRDSRDDDALWREDPVFNVAPHEMPPRLRRLVGGVFGNGRLASLADVAGMIEEPAAALKLRAGLGLRLSETTILIEASPDGSRLCVLPRQVLVIPEQVRQRHMLAVATTGGSKSMHVILPQIAADIRSPRRTVIVLDAKGGELCPIAQAIARQFRPGEKVECLNFTNSRWGTCAWDPVRRPISRSRAQAVANAVCSNALSLAASGANDELFWFASSVELGTDLLLCLNDDPEQELSLAKMRELVEHGAPELASYLKTHQQFANIGKLYPAIVRYLEGYINVTQQSVVADFATPVTLFRDEQVAAMTSGEGLDVPDLLRRGGIPVIDAPEADSPRLKPVTNLFVTSLLEAAFQVAAESPQGHLRVPRSIDLDELGSALGNLPNFEHRLATLRSRGVSIIGAVQTLGQLQNLYGHAAAAGIVEGFVSRIAFCGSLGLEDVRYFSSLSGQCTIGIESSAAGDALDGEIDMARAFEQQHLQSLRFVIEVLEHFAGLIARVASPEQRGDCPADLIRLLPARIGSQPDRGGIE